MTQNVNINNVAGLHLKKLNVENNIIEIPLDYISSGAYLVNIVYNNKTETYKIVF